MSEYLKSLERAEQQDLLAKRLMVTDLAKRFADYGVREAIQALELISTDARECARYAGRSQAFTECATALLALQKEL